MAGTHEPLLEQLTQCGILSADDASSLAPELVAQGTDTLVDNLVVRELLTSYQAQALREGNTKDLVLGDYIILDKLGEGGMGAVYKARHRLMNRVVALKVLPPRSMDSPEAVKRFHREVHAVAKLSHPNIVSALDAREANGVYFLVMELVDGLDLGQYVRVHGPMLPAGALECTVQAALGLAHAHERGIIHRDIKPSNLVLCWDTGASAKTSLGADLPSPQMAHGGAGSGSASGSGVVKILDMGLARFDVPAASDPATAMTQAGVIMGTVDYMAPEQAIDPKSADVRSDIYSLGCTLYYFLTGKAMYGGDTPLMRILAHREEAVPSLAVLRLGVPPSVDALYRKMVAKSPAERFQNMHEVLQAARACLAEVKALPAATPISTTAFSPELPPFGVSPGATPSALRTMPGVPLPLAMPLAATEVMPAAPPPPEKEAGLHAPSWGAWGLLLVSLVLLALFAGFHQEFMTGRYTDEDEMAMRSYSFLAGAIFLIIAAVWITRRSWPLVIGMMEGGVIFLVMAGQYYFGRTTTRWGTELTPTRIGCIVVAVVLFVSAALLARRRWPALFGGLCTLFLVFLMGVVGDSSKKVEKWGKKGDELKRDKEEKKGDAAAERLLQRGHHLFIQENGQPREVSSVKELPHGDYVEVFGLYIRNSETADLEAANRWQLKKLVVSSNVATETIQRLLRQQQHVEDLEAVGDVVSDDLARALAGSQFLRKCSLRAGKLTGAGIEALASIPSLQTLSLSNPELGDAALSRLAESNSLSALTLATPKLTDTGLTNFHALRTLTRLTITGATVKGTSLAHFKQTQMLTHLTIKDCPISTTGFSAIASLVNLQHLHLESVPIVDADLKNFEKCNSLQKLNLFDVNLSLEAVDALRVSVPNCIVVFTPK